jgi:O-antigen/teichoic acid export membrane protein
MRSIPATGHPPIETARPESLERLSLRTNFAWTFAGNVIYAGSQWGILAALTKLGSPRMVGQFSLGLAITAPIILLANLQLRAIQATDARDQFRYGDYLGLRMITTLLALGAILTIALVGDHEADTLGIILLIGLAKGFESLSDVAYGLLQKHERMDRMAISMILRGLLGLVTVVILVAATGELIWGLVGMVTAWLTTLLALDRPTAARVERPNLRRVRIGSLQSLVGLALPLGLVMSLMSLNANVPRYLIAHFLSEADLGYFASLAYVMVAGNLVVTALGQAAAPRLAQHYGVGDGIAFRGVLVRLIAMGIGLGATAVLVARWLGREILTFLYAADYGQHADVLVWLAAAAATTFVASFLGYAMTAARRFRVQIILQLASVITAAASGLILVPAEGIMGAAQSVLLASIVQLIGGVGVIWAALRQMGRARNVPK